MSGIRWVLVGVCAAIALAGCGGDDVAGRPDAGRGRDSGRPPPAPDSGAMMSCVHTGPPVLDPASLDPCPMCMGGRCLPVAFVPEEQRGDLADCDAMTKCVPDIFIASGGDFLLPSCRSIGNTEGRCVSTCIPQVAAVAASLPQATCTADERCAPCYDPTSGEDTGLCSLSCDTGPVEPAPVIVRCCDGLGTCLPESAVPADQRSQLGMDTCGAGLLCAPAALTDPTFRPATCRSIGGGEGRCLPECIPLVAEQADMLPTAGCMMGERCVPCYNPTDGMATGVCMINGDMPAEPPFTFPRCCMDGGTAYGTCVPMESVPPDRRMSLSELECPAGMGYLCAPTASIEDPDRPLESCTTGGFIGGGEPGACVLECLIGDVERFALDQSSCPEFHLCAPCMDPFSGDPTGACG